MKKKQIGIFSGSFNPIHIGHVILGSYMYEFTDLDEVWFVVTPHNPLKDVGKLTDDYIRLKMVRMALTGYDKLKASDVEFHLSRPSFTIDTLRFLQKKHPDAEFSLIIGGDNWNDFNKWKSYDQLRQEFRILVYPRLGKEILMYQENVQIVHAPIIEISSTFIRDNIKAGKDMRAFLPEKVWELVVENELYL